MEFIPKQDYEYLINKYHDTNAPFDPYKRRAYHGYDYDGNGLAGIENGASRRGYDGNGEHEHGSRRHWRREHYER